MLNRWHSLSAFFFLTTLFAVAQGSPGMRDPEKVHDPSTVIASLGVHRFFSTGIGISLMQEDAAGKWKRAGSIFAPGSFPEWHEREVPGNRQHLWAPDVIRVGDEYFVYYSVSTFGKNRSAIGLAVGKSLDPKSADWQWEDRGIVLQSSAADRCNAIDPAVLIDPKDQRMWMSYGSFWDGIFLIELDAKTGLRKDPNKSPIHLAKAPEIEAPFIHERKGSYYLFVNWGLCCRGVKSTYEIRVGRSESITGPYLDEHGVDLRKAAGKLLMTTEGDFIGPGHASVLLRDGKEWLVHHYYDRSINGSSRLRMVPLTWDEKGWPVIGKAQP
jgi:arabinan endo-1,5-alpha-L-arabinosidase